MELDLKDITALIVADIGTFNSKELEQSVEVLQSINALTSGLLTVVQHNTSSLYA